MSPSLKVRQLLDVAARVEAWAQRMAASTRKSIEELAALCRELDDLSAPATVPGPVKHVGQIARWLREEGRLTRAQLEKQTKIAASTIRNFETARHKATAATIRRLLNAPCMATLPELAKSAGLDLGLGDDGVGKP